MIPHEPRTWATDDLRLVRAASPLVLAACALAACGRVPGQFEIVNNQVPSEGCAIPVNESLYQGQGRLDVSLVQRGSESAFFVFPLLRNNLPGAGSGPDTNQITLKSFAIDISLLTAPPAITELINGLEASAATSSLLHYKTPWSGSVGSGGGQVSALVAAFPVELAARVLGTQVLGLSPSVWMNLRIRSFGSTTTQDMESDPFDYPVAICAGCLVANVQPCPFTAAPQFTGNPCNVAQDSPVDCCISGNDLVCPPTVVSQ
jgi:hypothetical protein